VNILNSSIKLPNKMKRVFFLIWLVIWVNMLSAQKTATINEQSLDLSLQRIEKEIARLSLISGGIVGISAVHAETGKRIIQNDQIPFPMASCYKIPIAIELLAKVDSGIYILDQLIEIEINDMHPGSGMIAERFNFPNSLKPGVALSIRNLLELMLLISDNSAADICLRLAGGPGAVNACMKRMGIEGLRIDRPTSFMIAELFGITMDKNEPWSKALFDSLVQNVKPENEIPDTRRFDGDLQDTSTPNAMSNLLLKLLKEPILKPQSKALLLDIMKRCETGLTRLKGLLPPDTEVMHKTGSIAMTANDVGIITLPGDGGHVVISVLIKSSEKGIPDRERAIAEVSRTIYDYFILNH
jgi:beta-lactamase class A